MAKVNIINQCEDELVNIMENDEALYEELTLAAKRNKFEDLLAIVYEFYECTQEQIDILEELFKSEVEQYYS